MALYTIAEIASEHRDVIADLQKLSPVDAAGAVANLLAMPELQANCIRIEALIHLALTYSEGNDGFAANNVAQQFARLDKGYCGKMEDPAEDVFLSLVNTPLGNFRIFEGVLEAAGFHLQRVLNIVAGMPDGPRYAGIRRAVGAMLQLSEAVAAKAGLRENCLGQETPWEALSDEVLSRLAQVPGVVRFDESELSNIGISKEALGSFIFNLENRAELRNQSLGHTELERRPIVLHERSLYLLLPTAVASAVIRFVIESAMAMGQGQAFEWALCQEYSSLFNNFPILGKRLPGLVNFEKINGGYIASAMARIDSGRILHVIFFVDGTTGFRERGLNGINVERDALSKAVSRHVKRASIEAKKDSGFRDGISLLISCGFGRWFACELSEKIPNDWRFEGISAHDLITLNWVDEFGAISLWRLLDAREKLEKLGVQLVNVNGLLNLVAWSKELSGHLVPHGELPDQFVNPDGEGLVLVRQNAIRELRYKVAEEWNPRRALDSKGRWRKVWKMDRGEFQEHNAAPFYASEEDVREGRLCAVYVAERRPWWITITAPTGSASRDTYERWMMLCAWLRRAAPVLDRAYPGLSPTPITCEVSFAEIVGVTNLPVHPKNAGELRALVSISAESGSSAISIGIGKGFDDGFVQPENIAEYILVSALVEAVAWAAGERDDTTKQGRLVAEICPDPEARWTHRFAARFFRDFVRSEMPEKLVLLDLLDDAALRIGLGWRVRSRELSPDIEGAKESTSFLNDVVRVVLDDLCDLLRKLDRRLFVQAVLENHEGAASDRDIWKQTARAILAMRDDKAAAMDAILRHNGRLNTAFLATRALLEAAICECPTKGGMIPGVLDISRAMALVLFAHHVGGWSDAIHWGAMESRVRVTPLGDVHVHHGFIDSVYEPFGRSAAEGEVKHSAASYEKLYSPLKTSASVDNSFDRRFLDAWIAEFGISLDGIRSFVDKLEDLGLQPPSPTVALRRSALVELLASSAQLPPDRASAVLHRLTLVPRTRWRSVTAEYTDKDWYPWRFRRRLSVLRRPLLQVDEEDDPTVVFAPGLTRDALYMMISSFHSGEVPSSHATSAAMGKWIGHANNVQRKEFNTTVALRMRDLGWQAEPEVNVTKILGRQLDRNYGDIDVLAWHPESGRVLAMECKDLQYNKTIGQVAEQLADFRGGLQSNGKPDHLRRHLDRLDVLNAHKDDVRKHLRLMSPVQLAGHVVFRNLVPMQFSWERMASRVELSLFAELDRFRIS